MHGAEQPDIFRGPITAETVRIVVVVLESFSSSAASSVRTYVRATPPVPPPHEALYWSGDIARTGRRVRLLEAFPGLLRLAKTLGFDSLELSVTAASMIEARSTPGMREPRRSSFSWSSALAVN